METLGIMSQGDSSVENHSPSIWSDISPLCRHFWKSRAWVEKIPPSFSLRVPNVYINTASKVKRQGPWWLRDRAARSRHSASSLAPQTNRQTGRVTESSQRLCVRLIIRRKDHLQTNMKKDCLIGLGQRYWKKKYKWAINLDSQACAYIKIFKWK